MKLPLLALSLLLSVSFSSATGPDKGKSEPDPPKKEIVDTKNKVLIGELTGASSKRMSAESLEVERRYMQAKKDLEAMLVDIKKKKKDQ